MTLPTTNLFFVPSTDPTAFGRRLAAAAELGPMVLDSGMGLPVLTRKADITAALRDAETFSTRMFAAGILKGGLAALGGEEHTRMRRIYNMFFVPRAVERYESSVIRPVSEQVAAELAGRARADLLDDFAVEVPKRIISALFGFSMDQLAENDARVRAMFRSIIRATDPAAQAEGKRAYEEVLGQITDLVEREESRPSDTLLGEILRTLKEEGMATVEAYQQIVLSLMLGGYETTIWMVANALHALLANPAALEQVRRDHALIPAAIDESMRWCPSVAGTLRLVERDVTLGGDLQLHAGSVIYLPVVAHYDEATHPSPEVFNLARRPAPTIMVFGGGAHYCVGAPLARMEARVALSTLLTRFPEVRLDPEEKPTFSYGVRESVAHGPDRLPALL